MRLIPFLATTALAATLLLSCGPAASAQSAPPSDPDVQTLQNYTLTEGFLTKWKAVMMDPSAPTCNLMTLSLRGNSLDEKIATYDARPGNHDYLASKGLTSREMVLGTTTMALAGMQEMSLRAPDGVEGDASIQVSAKNMAFHRSHKTEVTNTMQSASKARGDKVPNCAE